MSQNSYNTRNRPTKNNGSPSTSNQEKQNSNSGNKESAPHLEYDII